MEYDYDGGNAEPEKRMKASKSCPSSMQLKHMLLMCRGVPHLHHVYGVLQVIHVLMVSSHIQYGCDRLSEFDWELLWDEAKLNRGV